jgi:hypothetical protein
MVKGVPPSEAVGLVVLFVVCGFRRTTNLVSDTIDLVHVSAYWREVPEAPSHVRLSQMQHW